LVAYQLGIDLGDASTTTAIREMRGPTTALRPVTFRGGARVLPSELYVNQRGSVSANLTPELPHETGSDLVVRNFVQLIGDSAFIRIDGRAWTGQDLTAQLVREVVVHVTEVEGGPPTRTAVTHPAGWSTDRVALLEEALLNLRQAVTLVPGPLCAALSWGGVRRLNPGAMIVVYDLGASKLDVAVLRRTTSGLEIVGDPECRTGLGGNYFDDILFDSVQTQFAEQFEVVDRSEPMAASMIEKLRHGCTIAKEVLSYDTAVTLPVRLPGFRGAVALQRSGFEDLIRPSVAQTVAILRQVIATASGDELDQPDAVLLVGGSTGVPLVSELLSDAMQRPPARLLADRAAAGAVLALADRPLEPWTMHHDRRVRPLGGSPARPVPGSEPLEWRWRRSDLIAAGSLVVALLALLYSPLKDFQAERDKKSVYMQVNEIHWPVDGGGGIDPASSGENGEGLTVPSAPRATSGPARQTPFEALRVLGSSENIPGDQDLWIVLRPADDGRFYPVGRAPVWQDGGWELPESVCLPRSGTYSVFAYLTTSRSSLELAAWARNEAQKTPDQVQGMPSLPPEVTLLASQLVNRPPGRTGADVCTPPPRPSSQEVPQPPTLVPITSGPSMPR
jgi:hypothetical protein